ALRNPPGRISPDLHAKRPIPVHPRRLQSRLSRASRLARLPRQSLDRSRCRRQRPPGEPRRSGSPKLPAPWRRFLMRPVHHHPRATAFSHGPPLPVLRERAGVRACIERRQRTLTLTLSRSTGRGEKGFTLTELLVSLILLVLFFSAAG